MASHPHGAIFSSVPSKALVLLTLHCLWLSRSGGSSADPPWFCSCLCLPTLCLWDPPSARHIPGGAEPLGLKRAGRVPGMGQGRAGAEPCRGDPASRWWHQHAVSPPLLLTWRQRWLRCGSLQLQLELTSRKSCGWGKQRGYGLVWGVGGTPRSGLCSSQHGAPTPGGGGSPYPVLRLRCSWEL